MSPSSDCSVCPSSCTCPPPIQCFPCPPTAPIFARVMRHLIHDNGSRVLRNTRGQSNSWSIRALARRIHILLRSCHCHDALCTLIAGLTVDNPKIANSMKPRYIPARKLLCEKQRLYLPGANWAGIPQKSIVFVFRLSKTQNASVEKRKEKRKKSPSLCDSRRP